MTPASKTVLESLARMEQDADFQRVVTWFRECLSVETDNLVAGDAGSILECRGRCQVLRQIIEAGETAADRLGTYHKQ